MKPRRRAIWLLLAALLLTLLVYWPGLSGGWLFDDYPNIVDNPGVQPTHASIPSLVRAALSSPSSEFKRPLASLSFAGNYLVSGLNPFGWKLTNLVIHLLNGVLVFLLAGLLLRSAPVGAHLCANGSREGLCKRPFAHGCAPTDKPTISDDWNRVGIIAALIAAGWMLLPINLTGVLYVVQRMESMANLFVLFGLIGYVAGRQRMLSALPQNAESTAANHQGMSAGTRGFLLCVASIVACTGVGVLAKETAVMLPLYALLIEWILFGFRRPTGRRDYRLVGLFAVVLLLPVIVGLVWLLPQVFNPGYWSTRDFDLHTRLLSEARIVIDYIRWTLLPTPDALSFYHDDFQISQSLLKPWTTLVSIVILAGLIALMLWLRKRKPLAALGLALFFGCQLLTGTILPLELVYEHRNYFASFGLLLALVPLLAAPARRGVEDTVAEPDICRSAPVRDKLSEKAIRAQVRSYTDHEKISSDTGKATATPRYIAALPMALPRYTLLAGLMLLWAVLTALTAYAWGNPLRLSEDLASRAPQSPRAQYELGRTYILYSGYDPASPFTQLAYAPLEAAAKLPNSSILPQQALIFMNSRMRLPLKESWWTTMIAKLKARDPGVQDESSLAALTQCARQQQCQLPRDRMVAAFNAALSHPNPSARLLATYGDYAWNVLDDHALGEKLMADAVKSSADEPAYQITLIRMLAAQGRQAEAIQAIKQLETLNIGGRLNHSLRELRALPGLR